MTALASRRALVGAAFVAVATLLVADASWARAQEPTATIDIIAENALETGLDQLLVSLPPEIGTREVPASAFTVTQGGIARPLSVTRLPNEALDVVLAIDVSGSMAGAPIEAARQSALTFLREIPADARIAVVSFGDRAQMAAPFDSGVDSLTAAIESLVAGGETALYDSLALAADQFDSDAGRRRTVVVLSDGDDTVSTTAVDALTQRLIDDEVRVFGIALESPDFDPLPLQDLVAATDGRLVLATDTSALDQVYVGIASTLSNENDIEWEPLPSAGTDVVVTVSHLGVTATATTIYEAPTPPAGASVAPASASDAPDAVADADPVAVTAPEPGFLSSRAGLVIGAGMLGVALMIAAYLLVAPDRPSSQLSTAGMAAVVGRVTQRDLRGRVVAIADRVLERQGRGRLVGAALDSAGVALRPGEFVVIGAAIGIGAGLVGFLLGGAVVGLLFIGFGLVGVRAWLARRVGHRRRAFAEQLPSTLQVMSGTLRTGYALPQVLETVAREADSPTADEFHRLVTETRLGRDVGHSLRATSERMRCDDFDWVVRAIEIHREVGGDLSEVLGNVAATIRDRQSLFRTTQALTADGRMSAAVIIALPIGALILLPIVSPDYVDVLFDRTIGRVMLGVAAALIVVGWLWIRRLVNLRY